MGNTEWENAVREQSGKIRANTGGKYMLGDTMQIQGGKYTADASW